MTLYEPEIRPRVLDTFEVITLGWIVEAMAANDNAPTAAAADSLVDRLASWIPEETLEHYA